MASTEQPEACQNDSAIAAMMAAEWGLFLPQKKVPQYRTQKATCHEKVCGLVAIVGVLLALVGLAGFAISHGYNSTNSSSNNDSHHYRCPADLQLDVLLQEVHTATSLCRNDTESCRCQNPLRPATHLTSDQLPALQEESQRLEADLDVVFVGPSLSDPTLMVELSSKAVVVGGDDEPLSILNHRLSEVPPTVHPKVWWISLGTQDLLVDGCAPQVVQAGIWQLVEGLMTRTSGDNPQTPTTTIVLAAILSEEDVESSIVADFNERLACLAQTLNTNARNNNNNNTTTVEYFHPNPVVPDEDDDDFFLDVNSGGKSSSSAIHLTPEEIAQAILDKLDGMI